MIFTTPVTLVWRIHPDATSGQGEHRKYLKVPKQATTYYISGYSVEFSQRENYHMLTKEALVRHSFTDTQGLLLFKIPKILRNQLTKKNRVHYQAIIGHLKCFFKNILCSYTQKVEVIVPLIEFKLWKQMLYSSKYDTLKIHAVSCL